MPRPAAGSSPWCRWPTPTTAFRGPTTSQARGVRRIGGSGRGDSERGAFFFGVPGRSVFFLGGTPTHFPSSWTCLSVSARAKFFSAKSAKSVGFWFFGVPMEMGWGEFCPFFVWGEPSLTSQAPVVVCSLVFSSSSFFTILYLCWIVLPLSGCLKGIKGKPWGWICRFLKMEFGPTTLRNAHTTT